jgi:hypothetical protein
MKTAILTALLTAVCCVVVPIYGQEKGTQPATDKQTTQAPTSIGQNTAQAEGDKAKAEPQGYFSRLFSPENLPNIGLLIAGVIGIIVAVYTLKAINGQLEEMRSGGKVTTQQVQHLINAERAWIQVPEIIMTQILSIFKPPEDAFFVYFRPYMLNTGRTHARVTQIIAKAEVLDKPADDKSPMPPRLPEQPDFSHVVPFKRDVILSPKAGINWFNVHITPEELERIAKRQAFLYIYGRIDYVDISEMQRHTGFCKLYWIPYGPNDPNWGIENFIDSGVIPAAYTEST